MKKTIILLTISCLLISNSVFAVDFNDGESYTVGSEAGDDIYLGTGEDLVGGIGLDRWNSITPGTHLSLKEGGTITGIWANNNSTINMSGGYINQGIQMDGNSQLTVTGGVVDNGIMLVGNSSVNVSNAEVASIASHDSASIVINNASNINQVSVHGNCSLEVNGGWLGEWGIYGTDNSSITMNDGSTGHFSAYGDSTGNFNGGIIREEITVSGNAFMTMKSGTVQYYTTQSNGFGIIKGGVVEGQISAFDESCIDIKGGEVLGLFRVLENGRINLYGSDFYINGEPIGYGKGVFEVFGETLLVGSHYEGRITGTLADGTLFDSDFYIHNTGSYEGNADIVVIPEPSAFSLFILVGMMLRKKHKA